MSDEKPPGFEETPALLDAEIEPALPLTDEEEAALLEAEADADAGRIPDAGVLAEVDRSQRNEQSETAGLRRSSRRVRC